MAAIQGIGVDVIDMHRIRKTIDEMGDGFLRKLFTEAEISYCQSKRVPHQHFAARFAAKEAVSKALQTGWSGVFRWKDVEVVNEPSGAPKVLLHNDLASVLKNSAVHLTISHTENTVVAFAVIEEKPTEISQA
ncbi:MAG: holo-ACP synthase [Proteobacteria bacterium]|nr:holo-ACP synthase [Pseudomonadota bacterium]